MCQLSRHLDELIRSAVSGISLPESPAELYRPVRYTLEDGGKRIRPKLLLLATGLCGGDPKTALSASLAIEMLHNFTLIHDDIMDRAETRRGKPTVFRKWDEPTAILSGDVLFVLALKELLAGSSASEDYDEQTLALMRLFLDTIQTICDGQALDMAFEKRESVSLEEYLDMIRAKTAVLIQCSMHMGALVAEASPEKCLDCAHIGEHTGLAFQIQDDLLDVVGDSATLGKGTGGDIREGKRTYLSILALERADPVDRLVLESILGTREVGEEEILGAIRIYHQLGVVDDARKAVEHHYGRAMERLDMFEDSAYRKEIKSLLDQLMIREY